MDKLWSKKFLVTVVINLVPILGVQFLSWDMFNIFFFYWLEAGLFLVLAMLFSIIRRTPLLLFYCLPVLFWFFSGFFISGVFGKVNNVNEINLFFQFVKENIFISYWLLIASGLNYCFGLWKKISVPFVGAI